MMGPGNKKTPAKKQAFLIRLAGIELSSLANDLLKRCQRFFGLCKSTELVD